jgi:hypothetical protein
MSHGKSFWWVCRVSGRGVRRVLPLTVQPYSSGKLAAAPHGPNFIKTGCVGLHHQFIVRHIHRARFPDFSRNLQGYRAVLVVSKALDASLTA